MLAEEKRAYERVSLGGRCWCDNPSLSQYLHIGDASEGGFFIRTLSPYGIGERIRVRWGFPKEPIVHEACMEVVWRRRTAEFETGPGMGLRFVEIPERSAKALKTYITRSKKTQ